MNENDPKVNSDKPKTRPKKDPISNDEIIKVLSDLFDFRLNEVTSKIEILVEGVWQEMHDAYFAMIMGKARMQSHRGAELAKDTIVKQAIEEYSFAKRYDPIRKYLEECHVYYKKNNDGSTLSTLGKLLDAIDADNEQAKVAFITRWLFGCVGLTFNNYQNLALILAGPQGIGKTTFFRVLAKDLRKYYTEQIPIPTSADSIIKLSQVFLWQFDEFGAVLKSYNRNHMKSFITTESTNVRMPYDKYSKERPRRANLGGTTNDDTFLTDMTGNRRYLVLNILDMNLKVIKNLDIKMLWGEIVDAVKTHGVNICQLTDEERALQASINSESEIADPIEEYAKEWFEITNNPKDFIKTKDISTKIQTVASISNNYVTTKIADIMRRMGVQSARVAGQRGYKGLKWILGQDPNRTIAMLKQSREVADAT